MDVMQSEFNKAQEDLKDEEEKKAIVLDAVSSKCNATSEFEDLRKLAEALSAGDASLDAELVAGGKTNYSFKVFLAGDESKDLCVYAKLFLPYALWDKERKFNFDVQRAQCEFEMLQTLHNEGGKDDDAVVATPYFIMDVTGGAKLVVTQWATGKDEQWANQFIEGEVDLRVVRKVAVAMAQVNLRPIDDKENWNDSLRPGILSIGPRAKMSHTSLTIMPEEECDEAMLCLKQMGQGTFDKIIDEYSRQVNQTREVLLHGDSHPFNILVEPKPSGDQKFGPDAHFWICDWETSLCGPPGNDVGVFMAFPIACALYLAVQGHKAEATHLALECTSTFWESYAQTMTNKDATEQCRLYRSALGALGAYLLFNLYILGVLADTLPLEGVADDDANKARGAMGWLGAKFMLVAYDDESEQATLDLAGLQEYYKTLVESKITSLVEVSQSNGTASKPRRASFLRTLHRRISDASSAQEAASKMSDQALDWSYHKRGSVYENSDLGMSLGASFCSFVDVDDDMYEVTDEMKQQWAEDNDFDD